MLEVAAAVIQRPDGSFLLARRPAGKVYAGYWEFPGGKIEAGETPASALVRELREELGFEAKTPYPWLVREYVYPHAAVRLHFMRVLSWSGDPHPREAQDIAWQVPGEPVAQPMLPANAPVFAALALPAECAITAASVMGEAEQLSRLGARLRAGLRLIQVREPALAPPQRRAFAEEVVRMARPAGARVLINSDVDLARACGADGVHLRARDLHGLSERPADLLVGASCHDDEELERAQALGVDYVLLGPINQTTSHPGAPALGWDGFARLAQGRPFPIYAIGGLAGDAFEAAWRRGAHGIAMIRGAWPRRP